MNSNEWDGICPACGSGNVSQQLRGCPPEHDVNRADCRDCGWSSRICDIPAKAVAV